MLSLELKWLARTYSGGAVIEIWCSFGIWCSALVLMIREGNVSNIKNWTNKKNSQQFLQWLNLQVFTYFYLNHKTFLLITVTYKMRLDKLLQNNVLSLKWAFKKKVIKNYCFEIEF